MFTTIDESIKHICTIGTGLRMPHFVTLDIQGLIKKNWTFF